MGEEHVSTFRCAFDFSDMPFDEQTCQLTFLLPSVATYQMKLHWLAEAFGESGLGVLSSAFGDRLTNSEWEIEQAEDWPLSAYDENITGAFGPQLTSHISARFKIKRKPRSIFFNYVLQAVLIYTV